MRHHRFGKQFLGTVSALGLMAGAAAAQDSEDEDFIGTVELSQGKREVQVGTAAPITTINQEEIYDRQARTVGELIDSVPGVTLVNGNRPQGSGINIRGFGATSSFGTDQKVLVQIDGATTGSEELYRIGTQLFSDPSLYKQVSVIRGTVGSFEFGSGVIGGVVQMETIDASDLTGGEIGVRFRQTLGAFSNGEGYNSSSILAWQPTENLEFLLNYSIQDMDDYENGDGVVESNTSSKMPSYLIKGKYSFGDDLEHAITASLSDSTVDEKDVPYDAIGAAGGIFGNVDRRIDTRLAILRYEWNPAANDLIDLEANFSYSEQAIASEFIPGSSSAGPVMDPSVGPLGDADHNYEIKQLTIKNGSFFSTGLMSHDLRSGIEFTQRRRLDANSAPGGTDDRIALFVVDEMSFGNNWTVTPALRFETQDIEAHDKSEAYDNSALMGGISARYEFDSGFALFGSAAYTENLPIIDDIGKPHFMTQSEKSHTFEVGGSYSGQDLFASGDFLQAKLNFYTTKLWDISSYSSSIGGVFTPFRQINTDGVEIEATYGLQNGFYADLNASIIDTSKIDGDGVEGIFNNDPGNNLRLTLGKRFGRTWDASWELVAASSVDKETTTGIETKAGYGVHNLRATYTPQSGTLEGAEIRFGVDNVLDRTYEPALAARVAPGRTFKVTVAKTF